MIPFYKLMPLSVSGVRVRSAKLTAVNKPEIPKLYSKAGELIYFVHLFLKK